MKLNVLLQTKEKVWRHAREGSNNPSETKNQNQICQKKNCKKKKKKRKKKIYKQAKANNMRLMLHDCKINFMLMDNNSNTKMDWRVVGQTRVKMFRVQACVFWVCVCVLCVVCCGAWTWVLAQTHPCGGKQPPLTSLLSHLSVCKTVHPLLKN